MAGHDIIVIGASAGGFVAIREILWRLPADLEAAIFVAIHISREVGASFAENLGGKSSLPTCFAEDGEIYRNGRVYVAPPDRHLVLYGNQVRLGHGMHENHARPAIDPMFRSAAMCCGSRVIGVVLTGTLDDGSSGLIAVKQRGGIAVVQDPHDAQFSEMPRAALRNMAVDHCVTLQELPGLLTKLTKIPAAPEEHPPDALQNDIEFALDQASITDWETTGSIATLTCPECHGPLREMHEGNLFRYRCHTGHGFSLRSLGNALDTDVARALVTALRALQEKELMLRQLAERAISPATAQDWLRRADEYKDHGDRLKRVMHNVRSAPTQDPVGDELGGDAVLAEPASTADDRAPAAEQSRRRRTQAR